MNLKSYILVLLLFFPIAGFAGDWNDYIINYNKSLYGNGSQTWQIKSFNNRWMFFGNQNGLVQFSGSSWALYPLHNGTCLRSICFSQNRQRIYVGGINEFGYFAPGKNGKLVYTCLSDLMHGKQNLIGNIWNIFENENELYVVGDGLILKYVAGKFTYINAKAKIDCSGISNGVLYLGTIHGICILAGNSVLPLQGASILQNKRIRSILPYGNKILVVTAFDGVYCYDGQRVYPFMTGMESFLKQNEIFCAAISGKNFAAGSIRNGIAVVDLQTHQIKYFNEMSGMQNNTVLSAAFDTSGNLWAGLDSGGLDYILLNSPFTNLYSYPHSYGTGYTALLSDDLLYLGTNRGLFFMPFNTNINGKLPDMTAIKGAGGQVWGLNKIGSDIFCSHDRGLYLLRKTSMQRIGYITGVWNCQQSIGDHNKILVGVYDGMFVLERKGSSWNVLSKISGINESCRWFAQEDGQTVWVSNGSKLSCYTLDKQLTHVIKTQSLDLHHFLQVNKGSKVFRIDGHIVVTTPKGEFYYNRRHKQLSYMDLIKKDKKENISATTKFKNSVISLSPDKISIYDTSLKKETNYFFGTPSIQLVSDAETIIPVSESSIIIPNDNGFALFNLPQRKDICNYKQMLHIRNVYITYPKEALIYTDNFLSKKDTPKISYSHNSIRFEYGITLFTNIQGVVYQYRLNQEDWSGYTYSRIKEYSNLHEGKYTFEVKATLPNGVILSYDSFSFQVLPPWYRTGWAYFIYLILFALLLRYIYLWDDTRVKRKKQQAIKEKDHQIKTMEREYEEEKAQKERQIIQLEKDKLEYELKHKSQEMANLMINFVRKNEILTEIRSDLFKVLGVLKGESAKESKQMLILVRNKIESNIQGDEVLKKIEDQFDVVHNNFMKRLRETHPDLSNNERMMCAYLKMNLSTKEIAPLLNISIRGVETIRYRLRKKFGLEREDSLTEYLNNL